MFNWWMGQDFPATKAKNYLKNDKFSNMWETINIIDTNDWLYLFSTNLALNLSIVPSEFNLRLYTYFDPIDFFAIG